MENDPPGRKIDRAIGASLKDLRLERGLSARGLAEQSAISAAMISRIENGLVSPSIGTLEALAEALEVPIVSLFREARTEHTDFTLVRHGEGLKSTLADLKNTGPRPGGSITAALFLKEFVEGDIPWAHMDIAGTVWSDKGRGLDPAGATGYGVRTLVHWICSRANQASA